MTKDDSLFIQTILDTQKKATATLRGIYVTPDNEKANEILRVTGLTAPTVQTSPCWYVYEEKWDRAINKALIDMGVRRPGQKYDRARAKNPDGTFAVLNDQDIALARRELGLDVETDAAPPQALTPSENVFGEWPQGFKEVGYTAGPNPARVAVAHPHQISANLLVEQMLSAYGENPRGEKYRTMTRKQLFKRLRQNIDELALAYKYDVDVETKIADCANYLAFLLRNRVDPLIEY